MIITKLNMYNFGIYAGLNTLDFTNKKPVVLVGGINGRGKTTILEAVLLALYGQNSFAYKESDFDSYGVYLKSFVNQDDGSLLTYVELEFKLNNSTGEEIYLIRREWVGKNLRTTEKVTVFKNGVENEFLSINWSMYVENILPSRLSNFFFFDGEKMADIAVTGQDSKLKESIKALLGISILDTLGNDVKRIINKITRGKANDEEIEKLNELTLLKDTAIANLKAADDCIISIENEILATTTIKEEAEIEYTNKGGFVVVMQQDLFNERNEKKAELVKQQDMLVNYAAGELPLKLVDTLLKQILETAEKEHKSKEMKNAVLKIQESFKEYSNASIDVKNFVKFVETKANNECIESVYNLSDHSYYQLEQLEKQGLDTAIDKVKETMQRAKQLTTKVDEIDNQLSMEVDEVELAEIYKHIKEAENKLIELNVKLEAKRKERVGLHGQCMKAESEFNHFVEGLLSNLEMADDDDRVIKYAKLVIEVLEKYKVKLQRNKTIVLADTMLDCYKQLANKKNLINKIVIDPISFEFEYFSPDGTLVDNDNLSAGEKQLMIISLLWALAICSKKKLPVIIDTPLARMDMAHRKALISTYFPRASEQTIILSTDAEIDANAYELLKDSVSDEFLLVYDDVRKCTHIEKGYFKEA